MVEHKDVVLAVLGAASGLGGLDLVFLGIVITTYQGLPGDAGPVLRKKYRYAAVLVLIPFLLGMIAVGLTTWWLIDLNGGSALYVGSFVFFIAELLLIVFAVIYILNAIVDVRALWR